MAVLRTVASPPAARPGWRRALDTTGLRWQARLEGHGVDRSGPWLAAVTLGAVLGLLSLARSRQLSLDRDFAEPMQSLWLIGEGFRPTTSLSGYNVLSEQLSVVLYPLAAITKVLPPAPTLLVVQAAALALGVVPLWRLARRVARLRIGATVAVTLAYGLSSSVHALALAGFHPEVVAVPALLWAVLKGYQGHLVRYWLAVAVVLAVRADLGFAIAGLGALWLLEGRRRLGVRTLLASLAYAIVALFVVSPTIADGSPHVAAFSQFGDETLLDVLWGIITHPGRLLETLFSEANFRAAVALLAPVMFLPLVAPRYLMPAVPLFALYLLADVAPGQLVEAQQTVPVVAFVFVATIFALARIGRVVVERVNVDRRVVIALVLTAAVFYVRDSPASLYESPWSWGRRGVDDMARLAAADLVPDDGVVRASPTLLPLLAERTGLFELDTVGSYRQEQADRAGEQVNWIILDRTAAPEWADLDVAQFTNRLVITYQFEEVLSRDGITVLRLPAPP
jgi:uncharacterized membrane protein